MAFQKLERKTNFDCWNNIFENSKPILEKLTIKQKLPKIHGFQNK